MGKHKRFIIIAAFVGLGLLLAGLGAAWYNERQKTQRLCTDSGISKLLIGGQPVPDQVGYEQLGQILTNAKKNKGYTKSPSCLYLATVYAVSRSDAPGARTAYDSLAKIGGAEKSYQAKLKTDTLSLAELEKRVALVEKKVEQVKKNGNSLLPR